MRTVRFGAFEADLDAGELRKRGLKIRLPDQVFQVLSLLLEHPGEVVSRSDLRRRLWPHEIFVDFDHGLNKAVNRLREALSDSAGNPRFIETVAKRGYRLIVPVTRGESAHRGSDMQVRLRLAVLPFEDLSAEADQEFFSDGLTEEMISELGRVNPKRLGVIARTSAMLYKRSNKRIDEIGRELEVDYILEGSVRRADTRLRITAQLIQVRDQTHLWAESYSRELADIFELQHEVARRVANSLAFELLPEKGSTDTGTVSPEAYEAYLRGKFFWNKGGDRNAWSAIDWFQKAIEHCPGYALAYSAMAYCYGTLAWFSALPPLEAGTRAKDAALRALELDQHLSEAHCALALARFWFDWNWPQAEEEFRRAIALKPNFAAAHNWYAAYLNVMGRSGEAAAEQKIGEEWDPLSLVIAMNRADPYYFSRQYARAIENLLRVLGREPNFYPAHYNLGHAYAQSGRYAEAIEAFRAAASLSGVPQANAALAYAYAMSGNVSAAQALQAELEHLSANQYVPSPQMAWISLGLGDVERALAKLKQGFEEKSCLMIYLKSDPIYDPLRSHPEFVELMGRMNFI
jgi:TolB-like protein/Tfp pilus assembly protein PilF